MEFRKLIVAISLFCLPLLLQAQVNAASYYRSIEVFGGMGTTHYFGEVGGPGDSYSGFFAALDNLGFDPMQSRLGWSFGSRFEFRKDMAVTVSLNPLWIGGSDKNSAREQRGYAFDAIVVEGSLNYEYYFARRTTGLAPYGGFGLAASIYRFKPKQEQWSSLYYSPIMIYTIGTRLPSRSRITHGIELGFHYMFTDFMDGLNGNMKVGDSYYFVKYLINFELEKTFVYDHKGLIR